MALWCGGGSGGPVRDLPAAPRQRASYGSSGNKAGRPRHLNATQVAVTVVTEREGARPVGLFDTRKGPQTHAILRPESAGQTLERTRGDPSREQPTEAPEGGVMTWPSSVANP